MTTLTYCTMNVLHVNNGMTKLQVNQTFVLIFIYTHI